MSNYHVSIKEVSKDCTARERIMMKDTTNAIKLDEAISDDTPLVISPAAYAILSIHNDKSDNPDYENYVIIDRGGAKFVTGSPSFWSSFSEIWDEMKNEPEEYSIEVYKRDSKNYKGKQFLTCSIV